MSWKWYKKRDFPASWRPQKTCLPPFSMLFPILCALVSGSEFQHTDPLRKEFCGQMAGLVAEKGGNRLESSSRKASLGGKFLALRATKSRAGEGLRRPLWWSHEGVVAKSQGCCGEVTRVSWTIYDNLLNDGQIRMTVLFCANCYIIA